MDSITPPPSSFEISNWDNGEFAEVLFPEGNTVTVTQAPGSTTDYILSWLNGNGKLRCMTLTWNPSAQGGGGKLSGTSVTIYSTNPGTTASAQFTVPVTITCTLSGTAWSCKGSLNVPSLLGSPLTGTPTNGTFMAQASTGGTGGDGSYA